jgi:endonuclease/exonuclease/phosphatase family metal-dependent hydrolase
MKNYRGISLIVLLLILLIMFIIYNMKNDVKILSWNILADEFIKKRYYPMIPPDILLNRNYRRTQIIQILNHMDMDVMLLQEVMQGEYNALIKSFEQTHHLLRGKNIKWQNTQSSSGNVILLRKSLFKTPMVIHLPFGVGVHCTYNAKPLLIFNIHLDDISHPERIKQINQLLPNFSATPQVILGGDFNENYQVKTPTELYQKLKAAGLKILNQKPTYFIERKMCIDNILVKGITLKHQSAHVLDAFNGDRAKQFITYGSDHLPVAVN